MKASQSSPNNSRDRIILCCVSVLIVMLLVLGLQPEKSVLAQTTITFSAEELLVLPKDTSITVNVIPDSAIELYYEFDTTSGEPYSFSTSTVSCSAGESCNVLISGLTPNTEYFYRMNYHVPGETVWVVRSEHSFHTQRAEGETFTFVVTSDSHSSMNPPYFSASNYNKTLGYMAADEPDLWIDVGDTPCLDFMDTYQEYFNGNLTLRKLIESVSGDIPIFRALGNHEQEMGWNLDDEPVMADTQPVLAHNARMAVFPAPATDDFYTGNEDDSLTELVGDHLRRDYYEWTWGDAQFIILDPYWYTMTWPQEDSTYPFGGEENTAEEDRGTRWDWSLGVEQHLWLKEVLENSTAKYKFVFLHNLTGGIIPYGRGGTEIAGYFEWGGMNWDNTWGWDTERPAVDGWTVPTHELLDQNNVTILFHGHDHFYAQQELDDVVYQEVPMPAATDGYAGFMNEQTGTYASQYPDPEDILYYDGAEKHTNSGYLRVTVGPSHATVEYIDMTDGSVVTSYIVEPDGPVDGVLGDVNGDGEANSTDALIVLSGDAGISISGYCPIYCGDVNEDGYVNSTDALVILSFDADLTVPFDVGESGCPASLIELPPGCAP